MIQIIIINHGIKSDRSRMIVNHFNFRLVGAITELTVDISRLHIFNKNINNNNLSFNILSITIIQIIVYNYNRNLLKKIVCSICLSLTFCHLCITILLIIMIIIKYNILPVQ